MVYEGHCMTYILKDNELLLDWMNKFQVLFLLFDIWRISFVPQLLICKNK